MTRAGRPPPARDPFIVATGREGIKPDGHTRRFIRSHVMQGKNKRKCRATVKQRARLPKGPLGASNDLAAPVFVPSPERVLPIIQTGLMSPAAVGLVQNFMAVMKRAMYPIERCIGVGPADEPGWSQSSAVCHDPAYVHIVAYTALAYFNTLESDRVDDPRSHARSSHRALVHMNRGMRLLRTRIAALDFAATDATIFLVLALGMFSEAHNELGAAQTHLRGLHQLVQLRGGIASLAGRRLLQIKCCRLDLALALRTGQPPLFFSGENDLAWDACLAGPSQATDTATPLLHAICGSNMHARLVNVWRDLRAFTMALNLAQQAKTKVAPELFQEALISVHYRLHRLAVEESSQADENNAVLRLAMLAFSTTFFLEVHSDKFQPLTTALGSALQTWQTKQKNEAGSSGPYQGMQQLNLWLTCVAAVSVLSGLDDHVWLQDELRNTAEGLKLARWSEARVVLKQFLWVDAIHDVLGNKFFASSMT